MKHAISHFEIPVKDFGRAKKFYDTMLGKPSHEMEMDGERYAFFPCDHQAGAVGGGIRLSEKDDFRPSGSGVLIYLNANPDLSQALGRIEDAGGQVELPKTLIREDLGYMAIFHDTEGNRLALHSQQ